VTLLDVAVMWGLASLVTLVVLRWRYGPHYLFQQWTMALLWPWPLCVWLAELLDGGEDE
jgi:hypothetical protein